MNSRVASSLLALVLVAAAARASDVAIGARVGTSGIGPEVTVGVGPLLDVRAAGGFYSYDFTYDKTGVRYDATAELRNAIVTLDLHPFLGGFRLSVGGAYDDNRLKVTAPATELVRRYRPDLLPRLPSDLGTIHGEAKGNQLAPYAGIGWGQPFRGGRASLSVDLGVLYHGDPKVDLHTDLAPGITLPAGGQVILDAATQFEEQRLQDDLRQYRYLPVVAIGVTFRL